MELLPVCVGQQLHMFENLFRTMANSIHFHSPAHHIP